MENKKKFLTLTDYNSIFNDAVSKLAQARKDKNAAEIPALKEAVRVANENLRIFKYRAKPCLTQNGRLLRP